METVTSIILATGSFWISLILGLMFLLFPMPTITILRNYYKTKYLMGFAYISISVLSLYVLISNPDFINTELQLNETIRAYSPMIAIVQIIIFSYVNIVLIKPKFLKIKKTLYPLIPTIILIPVYIYALLQNRLSVLTEIMYYSLIGFFALMLIYYIVLFFRYYHQFRLKLNNYYSEVSSNHLQWVLQSQIIILASGFVAFFAGFLPAQYMGHFLTVMNLFFFYYAIRYLRYGNKFSIIEAILDEKAAKDINIDKPDISSQSQLEDSIIQWENNKRYTEQNLTIDNVATSLRTNRTYLSNHINSNKNKTFNEWINGLRINEAKKLLQKTPEIPICEISERVGFTDKSNFGRNFNRLTGNTPAAWRKENSNGNNAQ